ncbi:MAG: transcription repressor NadR [bacterium]|nr:transcription repressor NadR [bacterium]
MDGKERRDKIVELLGSSADAISGNQLAKILGVSRQVVVQDIALLRATNKNIISTTRGYMLYIVEDLKATRSFLVRHTTEQIEDELCVIVDNGGKVLDVTVMHDIYGQIQADLIIKTRQEVYEFVEKVKTKRTVPLKELTDGIHVHTVEADSENVLDRIEDALRERGFLVTE